MWGRGFGFAPVALLAALAACQTPPSGQTAGRVQPGSVVSERGLPSIPSCPSGVTAVMAEGPAVHFQGPADDDPAVCVQTSNGRSYRYYLDFWGNGRFREGTPGERQALRSVVEGPVGTEVHFALPRQGHPGLWKSASVAHVANDHVAVGRHVRPAIKLRIVRHDAHDRPGVKAESLYWLDRLTGIPLKKEVVTHMADGDVQRTTTWRVVALEATAS